MTSCQDIIVNRNLTIAEINLQVSQMFAIKPSEILVVEDIPEYTLPKSTRILCEVQYLEGDFKQMISIYFRDNSLSNSLSFEAIGRFCEFFKCTCLVSDNDVNPYSRMLIKGVNNYQTVYLSPELLDEGEYTIADEKAY